MQEDPKLQVEQVRELVSALVDGELAGAEFVRAVDALQAEPQMRASWHDYQLLGEVMRKGRAAAVGAHDEAFVARLRTRLVQERPRVAVRPAALPQSRPAPANEAVWRWKLVAGLCSLAVVAVLGWQLVGLSAGPQVPQLAAVPALSLPAGAAVAEAPVMIRDPRLDQLIAAHQQQGGTSALQMPAGFLRNATFERPAR